MPHVELGKVWKFGIGKARELLGRYSPEQPPTKKPASPGNPRLTGHEVGRRDWTRTNDPHHVKVVL